MPIKKSQNRNFPTDAPLDNCKALITIFPLKPNNYNFILNLSTVYQFTILPLLRAPASFYPSLPLKLEMLHTTYL